MIGGLRVSYPFCTHRPLYPEDCMKTTIAALIALAVLGCIGADLMRLPSYTLNLLGLCISMGSAVLAIACIVKYFKKRSQ